MKRNTHIVWLSPDTSGFYRKGGEVRIRPSHVLDRLLKENIRFSILLPFDIALLPKTKMSADRITSHPVPYQYEQTFQLLKLSRGNVNPSIYMFQMNEMPNDLEVPIYSWAGMALGKLRRKVVDLFYCGGSKYAFVPLFLEGERNVDKIFEKSKVLSVYSSLKEKKTFAPQLLDKFKIPRTIFHPEGVQFYGGGSFIKTGMVFSNRSVFVRTGQKNPLKAKEIQRWQNVINKHQHKIESWSSDRSARSYLKTFDIILSNPSGLSPWTRAIQQITDKKESPKKDPPYPELWGPPAPSRYKKKKIQFLIQSPTKGYVFWEWAGARKDDYGLIINDHTAGSRSLQSRGLPFQFGYWVSLQPGHRYSAEFVGWDPDGQLDTLMKTKIISTPRNKMQHTKESIFVNVKNNQIISLHGLKPMKVKLYDEPGTFNADSTIFADEAILP
jgi:hypothetical protein